MADIAEAPAKQRWVAYSDLGPNGASGSFVDPDNHGGVDSDNWKYMVDHRVVLPLGDPDAALVMGSAGAVAAADAESAARDEEMQALKARIKELEDAAATKSDSSKAADPKASVPPVGGNTPPPSNPGGPGSGGGTPSTPPSPSAGTKTGG